MAQQIINIGTSPNDNTGDNIRNAFDKTNDNFDELYTADGKNVKLTGNQTIAGDKTLTGNTNVSGELSINSTNRANNFNRRVKNASNNGGVRFSQFIDADNAVIGTRKYGFWGYPLKDSDGSEGGFEEFMNFEFPTYDGNTTYTKVINFNSPNFNVNGQNWTSAWTSYTPALINSTGATATITNAKIIPVGKIAHINVRLVITSKGTSSGDFGISMPVTSISDISLSGGLFPINTKDSRGFPVTTGSQIKFTKQSQAALVSWADVSVNDELTVSGVFEIA